MEITPMALPARIRGTASIVRKPSSLVSILDPQGKETTGVSIAGRGEVALQSGGTQIVLSGLKKPLRANDSFDLTLVFRDARQVKIEVLVEDAETPITKQPGG
jgi:Copper chaperone PCu(A)C